MYLISDDFGDFKEIMNYKQLLEFLIDEIMTDTKLNYKEYDIVKDNVEQLGKLAKHLVDEQYIVNNLSTYGWSVTKIVDIQRGLNNIREYVARKSNNIKVFDDILKYLDEELKIYVRKRKSK